MEKQPVDDLFARKLREAEVPVSPDALKQLQRRLGTQPLETKRSVSAWWYVAAASLLLIGAFVFLQQNAGEKRLAANNVARSERKREMRPIQSAITEESAQLTHTRQVPDGRTGQSDIANDASHVEKKAVKAVEGIRESTPLARVQKQRLNGLPIQVTQPSEEAVAMKQTLSMVTIKTSLPAPPSVQLATTKGITEQPTLPKKQSTERVIVMNIDDSTPIHAATSQPVEEKQKNTGVANLFGKLRQLKNGEVLARAEQPVATDQNSPKKRLNRVLNEVKESLKNETTLE